MTRLSQIIESKGLTKKRVADALGIHPSNIGRYEDLSKRSIEELKAIAGAVDVDLSKLISNILEEEVTVPDDSRIERLDHPKSIEKKFEEQQITLYDVSAAANLKTLFANKDQNILGKISIPDMPKCDGAVFVTGDSMYPLLKSGDIIAYKEVHDFRNVIFGEMYLVSFEIEGDEFLTVKYVNRSEIDGCIRLVSYNTHHDPKDIPLSTVKAMALVKLSVRKNTMR